MSLPIPTFDLKIVRDGHKSHLSPSGELDIATAPELERAIAAATAEPGAQIVLDLRELTFMDSSGLRTLAQTNAQATKGDFELSIVRGPRQIERVLEISGLASLLPLVDGPTSASGCGRKFGGELPDARP